MEEVPRTNPPAEAEEEEEEKEYPTAGTEGTEDDAPPAVATPAPTAEARTSDWLKEQSTGRLYSAPREDDPAGSDPDEGA